MEESEDQAIERIFASDHYNTDFEDIVPKATLEAITTKPKPNKPTNIYSSILTDEQIEFVCDIHQCFVKSMATSQWICNDLIVNKNILKVDYDNVLKMKAKTFTLLHNELVNGISYITDKTLLPTLQMLLKITINQNSKFLGSQPFHS